MEKVRKIPIGTDYKDYAGNKTYEEFIEEQKEMIDQKQGYMKRLEEMKNGILATSS